MIVKPIKYKPETYTTFLIHKSTYCLRCHSNNSCLATTRLAMNHQRILTWAFYIVFNVLFEKRLKVRQVLTGTLWYKVYLGTSHQKFLLRFMLQMALTADHNEKNLDSEAASSFVSVGRSKGAI